MPELELSSGELREAYERAIRSMLWRVQPRRLQARVQKFLAVAGRSAEGRGLSDPLAAAYSQLRERVIRVLYRRARRESPKDPLQRGAVKLRLFLEQNVPSTPYYLSPDFMCDAAMGGLARWLRAYGYDAEYWPDIGDDDLLRKQLATSAILLTTDRRMLERGLFTRGAIPAVLVPVLLTKREQFWHVARLLELPRKNARCMNCGGRLLLTDKTQVLERIPPKTLPWLDEYFVCSRCDQLFWEGTHWQRVEKQLDEATTLFS